MRWLWSLFQRNPRNIFPYHDGTRKRWADPLAVHRVLDAKGGQWQGLLSELSVEHAMADQELSPGLAADMNRTPQIVAELAGLVRAAFDVRPLGADDRGRPVGLSDLECLDLLTDYLVWLREVEADCLPLSSSPKRESPPPSASSEDTGEWSVCGSPASASA